MQARAATPHLQWLVDRVGCALTPGARAIAAFDTTGNIRGMVAYDVWCENSVQAHVAVDTPAAWRALLPAIFFYPFVEADKGVLLCVVRGQNTKSLRVCAHLGFQVKAQVKDGFALGDDLVLLEMRREHCRWLKGNGWRKRQQAKEAA
jgi:hypothetical protein